MTAVAERSAVAPAAPPRRSASWLWATVPNEFHCAPKLLMRCANWSWLRFWLASRKVAELANCACGQTPPEQ